MRAATVNLREPDGFPKLSRIVTVRAYHRSRKSIKGVLRHAKMLQASKAGFREMQSERSSESNVRFLQEAGYLININLAKML
jgi:hypothetical protein